MNGNLSPEILAAIQSTTQDSVNAATQELKQQLASIKDLLQGAKMQSEDPKPADEAKPAEDPKPADEAKPEDVKQAEEPKQEEAKQSALSETDVRNIVQSVLKEIELKTQATAQATAHTEDAPVTMTALQSALAEFGKSLATGLAESQRGTVDAVQAAAQRISELPIPRATAMRTMSNNDRTSFIATVKQKVESGADLSFEDMQRAEQLGADFSLADPFCHISK